jgi:hypothetical protein
VISRRQVQLARDVACAHSARDGARRTLGCVHARGDLAAAGTVVAEAEAVSETTGIHLPSYGAVLLAARRGREAEALQVFEPSMRAVTARGEGIGVTHIQWATAMLSNALGRYDHALEASAAASARLREFGFGNWGLVDLIEAALRAGDASIPVGALEELSDLAHASGVGLQLAVSSTATDPPAWQPATPDSRRSPPGSYRTHRSSTGWPASYGRIQNARELRERPERQNGVGVDNSKVGGTRGSSERRAPVPTSSPR